MSATTSRRPRRPPRRNPSQTKRPVTPARRNGLVLALLTAAAVASITLAAYRGAFDHAFVAWDDPAYVEENAVVQQQRYGELLTSVVCLNYHPLTMISLAMNAGSPLTPRPFLVTNVALHVLNTILVFWLTLMLSGRRLPVAACVALLFGIHPLHVESVAWISERKDVLYAFFFLSGSIAYWHYLARRAWPWLALTFALFVLSCMSKGMAVSFPLIMALLDYWSGRRVLEPRAVLEKAPFLAVAFVFGLVAVNVQAGGDFHGLLKLTDPGLKGLAADTAFTPLQRLVFPAYGHLMYVWRLFVPVNLCHFYPYPPPAEASRPEYLLAPLFLLVTLAIAIWDLRRTRLLTFGIGWYLATVLMVLQWIPVGAAIMADRYTYLPYIGLTFTLAMGVSAVRQRSRGLGVALWGLCGLFSVLLFVQTTRQLEVWRNNESLWTRVIRLYPGTGMAYVNRGTWLGKRGRVPEAVRDLQTARSLGVWSGEMFEGLGNGYGTLGDLDSALVMFGEALRIEPRRRGAYYNRAITFLRLGRPRAALTDLDRALELDPLKASTIYGPRGLAHMLLGEYREAAGEFDRAIAAADTVPDTFYNRGLCRLQLGDRDGAAGDFRATLRLRPDHAGAKAQLQARGG
jgi:Flp pilus assembly protein TadD